MSEPFKPKILAFAGSTREGSYNKKLLTVVINALAAHEVEVTRLDLRDIPMPLYDGDLEDSDGIPENGWEFRKLLKAHHGFIMACPEYNSSITGVLKNAIDWASRPVSEEPPLVCFKGKIVSLLSASPGGLGGLRGLVHVRSILGNIGSIVLPDQLAVSQANKAFTDDGTLIEEFHQKAVEKIVAKTVEMITKIGR